MNKRKNRIIELMKLKGIDTQEVLLHKVLQYINPNMDDIYEEVNKAKGNFSKKIENKDGRTFNEKEIIALEKILGKSFNYIVNGEDTPNYNTIKNIEYYVRNEEYDDLIKETDKCGNLILFNEDEYQNNIIDYIIKYSSVKGISILIERFGMRYSFIHRSIIFDDNKYININREHEYNIFKLLANKSELDILNKLINVYEINRGINYWRFDLYNDERIIQMIVRNKNLLNNYLNYKEIDFTTINKKNVYDDINKCYMINPIMNKLFNFCVKYYENYKNQLTKILEKGKEFNEIIINQLLNSEESFTVDENGYIISGTNEYGCILKPVTEFKLFDNKQNELIENIEVKINELIYKDGEEISILKMRNKKYQVVNKTLCKKSSGNDVEYTIYDKIKGENISRFFLEFIETAKGVDKFHIFSKVNERRVHLNRLSIGKILINFFKEFTLFIKEKTGKTIVHNNITDENVILNNNQELEKIIGWDECEYGEELYNLYNIITEYSGIKDQIVSSKEIIENIGNLVNYYDENIRVYFVNEYLEYLNCKLNKELESSNKSVVLKLKYIIAFIETYIDELNNL